MQQTTRSMLVISPDRAVADAIGSAVADLPDLKLRTETATLSAMNGRAADIAAGHDLVVFQTDPADAGELAAIARLTAARREGTFFVALADGAISLSQAHALTAAGVDEVLPIPGPGQGIAADLARLGRARTQAVQARAAAPSGPRGRIIAIAPARGGVGATTVSVNLADRLTGRRRLGRKADTHRVALVDLDLQFGTVGTLLDLPEQDAFLQLAMDGTLPDANFLGQAMTALPSGLSVLAAPSKFAPLDALSAAQVGAILDALRAEYDYIVVDLPHALVGWIEPVIREADAMIMVTDTAVPSIRHCRRLIDFFSADNLSLPIQIVANHEQRPLFPSAAHREAAKALERKIEHWLPHDPRARTAADQGKPLSAIASRAPLSRAIARLARSIETAFPAQPGARTVQ